MSMTITEKILAARAGRASVEPGENVWCDVDVLMTHDVCGPGTIGIFEAEFGPDAKVWDPDRVVIVPDHYIFTADPKAHRNVEILRRFVAQHGIRNYYDPDFLVAGCDGVPEPYEDPARTAYRGVCHVALPQNGHTRPGELLLGTDSHTCTHGAFGEFATGIGNTEAGFVLGTGRLWLRVPPSIRIAFDGTAPEYVMAKDFILHVIGEIGVDGAAYRAMEFVGEAVGALDMDERCTICNMAIEAGGKNGIIAADEKTLAYVKRRAKPGDPAPVPVASDENAGYLSELRFDAAKLEPTVACPHSPDKRAMARDLGDVKVDRVYIGSCTGGKTADFVAAARILAGQTAVVETFIVPATVEVDADLDRLTVGQQTLREAFLAAGCRIGPASCAACLGGPADTFGRVNAPLTVVSTTNRNFPGRMGHKDARIYLASPLTAAATAVTGHITDPREYL